MCHADVLSNCNSQNPRTDVRQFTAEGAITMMNTSLTTDMSHRALDPDKLKADVVRINALCQQAARIGLPIIHDALVRETAETAAHSFVEEAKAALKDIIAGDISNFEQEEVELVRDLAAALEGDSQLTEIEIGRYAEDIVRPIILLWLDFLKDAVSEAESLRLDNSLFPSSDALAREFRSQLEEATAGFPVDADRIREIMTKVGESLFLKSEPVALPLSIKIHADPEEHAFEVRLNEQVEVIASPMERIPVDISRVRKVISDWAGEFGRAAYASVTIGLVGLVVVTLGIHLNMPQGLIPFLPTKTNIYAAIGINEVPSVAILPFQNLTVSAEQRNSYEQLMNRLKAALAREDNLDVVDIRTMFAHLRRPITVEKVAAEGSVSYVINGTMLGQGTWKTLEIRLIHASTRTPIWRHTYYVDLDNLDNIDTVAENASEEIVKNVSSSVSRGN